MNLNLEQAEKIITASKEKAVTIKTKMSIAIVDSGANLLAFSRMDDALLGTGDIAIKKAKTAMMFKKNTGNLGELSQPGKPLFNIEHSNGGLVTFPGGVPVKNNEGQVIGAIGVSGGSIENDHIVAEAGAFAL